MTVFGQRNDSSGKNIQYLQSTNGTNVNVDIITWELCIIVIFGMEVFKHTKFWCVTVAVIYHFSDGPRLLSDCQYCLRDRWLDAVRASYWPVQGWWGPLIGWYRNKSEVGIITRLNCHYKARKLTNSMRIPASFAAIRETSPCSPCEPNAELFTPGFSWTYFCLCSGSKF